jgi:hypothetical protein
VLGPELASLASPERYAAERCIDELDQISASSASRTGSELEQNRSLKPARVGSGYGYVAFDS